MPLVDDRTLIAVAAVLLALQVSGVDVIGVAGDWATQQFAPSWWPF